MSSPESNEGLEETVQIRFHDAGDDDDHIDLEDDIETHGGLPYTQSFLNDGPSAASGFQPQSGNTINEDQHASDHEEESATKDPTDDNNDGTPVVHNMEEADVPKYVVPPSPRQSIAAIDPSAEEDEPSLDAPIDPEPIEEAHEDNTSAIAAAEGDDQATDKSDDEEALHQEKSTTSTPSTPSKKAEENSEPARVASPPPVGIKPPPPRAKLPDSTSPSTANTPNKEAAVEMTDLTAAKTTNDAEDKDKETEEDLVKAALYNSKDDNNLSIVFKNVSHSVQVPVQSGKINTFFTPITSLVQGIATGGKAWEKREFYRCRNISGVIKPATMTLVLSPPGHGKSTYLRMLGHRVEAQTGHILYNGRTYQEAAMEGIDVSKMIQYVDQVDTHLPLLTVTETLEFAHKMSAVEYRKKRVDAVIAMLGLEECKDTIIGDALIRGVSGGQRKRVSTGEMLVSDASTLFLDEFSNGLDTATSEDIARALRQWCTETNGSIVATLQQPTPGLFELFDRVVVLREGSIVYDGPQPDLLPYFEAMGFKCPDDVDVCDFIIDCLTQPRLAVIRQREIELHHERRKAAKAGSAPPTMASLDKQMAPKNITTTYGTILSAPTPCITTEEMCEYYASTPFWAELKQEIDKILPTKPSSSHQDDHEHDNDGQDDNASSGIATRRIVEERVHVPADQLPPMVPTESARRKFSNGTRMSAFIMLTYLLARQVKIMVRNTGLLMPRIMNAILMSLIYGSIYWNVSPDAFFLRVACLLISLTQVGFGNMVELPVAVAGNRVVFKQLASNFYPSWAYIITSMVISLPIALVESIIFSVMLYWMCGNAPYPMEFFVFFFIILVQSINLSAWFRFLSVVSNDEAQAQSIAGPSTGVFMIFGGLFVTEGAIPRFMIWLYWLSPFSWSTRALANNEFLSPRYDDLLEVDGRVLRKGDVYIEQLDMFLGEEWIIYSVVFLLGTAFVFLALQALLMRKKWYEESIGTRRNDEEEMAESELDAEIQAPQITDEATSIQQEQQQQQQQAAIAAAQGENANGDDPEASKSQSQSQSQSQSSHASSAGSVTSFNLSALRTLREKLPFSPTWLSFSGVRYTVKVKQDKELVDRVLLDGVYGYAEPGKLTALMGASGAGKTTLLDVLAGRKNVGVMEGKILVNGQSVTVDQFANVAGYVEQFDTLFACSTVRETLLFAARLRLPNTVEDDIKQKIVDEVLEILDLTSIQHFIIGNPQIPGLSPSQLKRVNIGVELVANPAIIFLDEPTTGLDSKSAQTVMRVVRRIARSGRSVICTIHQPSAELFYMFDRLVLLGSGGQQIYFGDLGRRCRLFIEYLSNIPGVKPIPPRYNPASWMLEELGVGVATMKEQTPEEAEVEARIAADDDPEWADLTNQQRLVQRFKRVYFQSQHFNQAQRRLQILESLPLVTAEEAAADPQPQAAIVKTTTPDGTEVEVSTTRAGIPTHATPLLQGHKPGFFFQLAQLFARNFMGYYRNPPFIFTRLVSVTILSILFGLIYLGVTPDSQSNVVSAISATVMAAVFGCLIHGASALPVFMSNREVYYRERTSGFYHAFAWPIVNLGVEMVWCALGSILIQLPAYWMVGLRANAAIYFQYLLAVYLNCLIYVAVTMFFTSLAPTTPVANILMGSYFSIANIFAGIAIPLHSVPKGWLWVFRVFPASHLTEALVMPQFENNMTMIDIFLEGDQRSMTVHDYVIDYLGFIYGLYWKQMGWMLLFFVVIQILAYLATYFLVYNKR